MYYSVIYTEYIKLTCLSVRSEVSYSKQLNSFVSHLLLEIDATFHFRLNLFYKTVASK